MTVVSIARATRSKGRMAFHRKADKTLEMITHKNTI
jgi:hypothetical protein